MSDLIQGVSDGVIEQSRSSMQNKKATNDLDKDAFLKLLVTQLKYQDPLNPDTDTEFIAQLATFSQLEQLQNLSEVSSTSQALSLVGKNVMVRTESPTGEMGVVTGRVDFVSMSGGRAQLSIDGKLYSVEQLETVVDNEYMWEQGLPHIEEKVELEYDAIEPKDQVFNVNMGQGDTKANSVAIVLNGEILDQEYVHLSEGEVTISKEAFADVENGIHNLIIIFNDPFLTTVTDMVTIEVKNVDETL